MVILIDMVKSMIMLVFFHMILMIWFGNDWNNRLLTLKNTIDYWYVNKTEKTLEEIKLFFDE